MTTTKLTTWRFRAVGHVNVQDPTMLVGARSTPIIGKTWDPKSGDYVVDADGATFTAPSAQAPELRRYFGKCLKAGELLPADQATADAFGVALPKGNIVEED